MGHRQSLILPAIGPSRMPLRQLSTSRQRLAPEPDQSTSPQPSSAPPVRASRSQPFLFNIPQAPVEPVDPDAWWASLSTRRSNSRGYVLPKYSSRSFVVNARQKSGFKIAVSRMKRVLRDANIRKKVRLDQYHEVGSVKRRRLKSERHRRRFQALVSVHSVAAAIAATSPKGLLTMLRYYIGSIKGAGSHSVPEPRAVKAVNFG